MKFQKTVAVIVGIILLLAGFNFLFEIFNIVPRQWLLFAIGVILLAVGLKNKNSICRTIGLFLTVIGAAVFTEPFLHFMYMKAIYCAAIAIALIIEGILRKNNWICFGGGIVALIAVLQLLQVLSIPHNLYYAYGFIVLATFFVIVFIVKNRVWGYMPLVLGIMCYLLSIPQFLLYAEYMDGEIAKAVSAVLMIITGVLVMLKVFKIGTKEKKGE